jgi:hypothetical protein
MGMSSAISLTGSYPMTVTLTAAQYANHVIQFTGTPSALGQLNIVAPVIAGGASGYCLIYDFTQATMAGWTGGMKFDIGTVSGPSVSATTPSAQGAYTFCYDGTTPRIYYMAPG